LEIKRQEVFLIRELVNTRMRDGSSVTEHINEVQALLLLSSLPDSWSGTVTAVTSSSDTSKFMFMKMRDFILGEDVRRRNSGGSSGDLMHVGRGRKNNRSSGSKNRKRSQSRTRNDVTCWNCKQVGHFRNQCPNNQKEVNAAEDHSEDDL